MSRQQRIALIAAAVVVAVVAFIAFRPSSDNSSKSSSTPSSTTASGGSSTAAPKPSVQTITITKGQPDGGLKKIDVKKGDTLVLKVTSSDTKDEVHVHGYDLHGNLAPGKPVKISFKTKIEGIFEIELEGTKTQIAELKVEP